MPDLHTALEAAIPDAVYEAAAEALIATRDVIRAETDWCLECAGEEVAALRAAKIAIDAVAPLLIAEGRRQAAEAIRAPYVAGTGVRFVPGCNHSDRCECVTDLRDEDARLAEGVKSGE